MQAIEQNVLKKYSYPKLDVTHITACCNMRLCPHLLLLVHIAVSTAHIHSSISYIPLSLFLSAVSYRIAPHL